jgi:acyl carrier protein phosphodiesterase
MNYLAHAYLSFNEPEIIVGNMISDFIKGKKKFDFSRGIQKGIELHRAIDEFTDNHPAIRKAKEFFKKDYRLYSGAFIDIVYDHFLANDKNEFADEEALKLFSSKTYSILQNYESVFPDNFKTLIHYMKKEDWLYSYKDIKMIEKCFASLVRRASYLTESTTANELFILYYGPIQDLYKEFFPEVKSFTIKRFSN